MWPSGLSHLVLSHAHPRLCRWVLPEWAGTQRARQADGWCPATGLSGQVPPQLHQPRPGEVPEASPLPTALGRGQNVLRRAREPGGGSRGSWATGLVLSALHVPPAQWTPPWGWPFRCCPRSLPGPQEAPAGRGGRSWLDPHPRGCTTHCSRAGVEGASEGGYGPFKRVTFISREHTAVARMSKKKGSMQTTRVTPPPLRAGGPIFSTDTEGKDWP